MWMVQPSHPSVREAGLSVHILGCSMCITGRDFTAFINLGGGTMEQILD